MLPPQITEQLQMVCTALAPDNIDVVAPKIVMHDDVAYGLLNPAHGLLEHNGSVLLGQLYEPPPSWHDLASGHFDGSYALFHSDAQQLSLKTDAVGARTIWYYADDNLLVAATSQRAIIMLIGSFVFNEAVVPWLLSTGTLGPALSWDARIKQVPPNGRIQLDKQTWTLSVHTTPIAFAPAHRTTQQHQNWLRESLEQVFARLDLDLARWVLPLSGGYDSRAILCLLRHQGGNLANLKTITWGTRAAQHRPKNDASIAAKLAKRLGVAHQYYPVDDASEPFHKIVERFILQGEGRIDHLAGYMDGFGLWQSLYEDGIQGLIRGDEGFGWTAVSSPFTVRQSINCALCDDFANLQQFRAYGLPAQTLPTELKQRPQETLPMWRDRLYHQYRIPTILAALSDLKLGYVELTNPFLAHSVLQQVYQLPDALRTNKMLFRRIVDALSPNIPYAHKEAVASVKDILRQPEALAMLQAELDSERASSVLPPELLHDVQRGMMAANHKKRAGKRSLKRLAKEVMPRSVHTFLQNAKQDRGILPSVDPHVLAFRLFIISRMNTILQEDAARMTDRPKKKRRLSIRP